MKFLPAKITRTPQGLRLETIDRPVRVRLLRQDAMEMMEKCEEISSLRLHIGQKSFTSKCFWQPKQIPVKYSETMILKLGSTKKRYFESVYYETKLVPSFWSETMMANLCSDDEMCKSDLTISREETEHYISLEPQQLSASTVDVEQSPEKL